MNIACHFNIVEYFSNTIPSTLLPRTKLWFHLTSSGDSKMTQSFFVCLIGPLIGALTEISVDVFTVGLEWRGYIYVWNLPLTYFSRYGSKSSLMYPKEVLAVEHFPVVSSWRVWGHSFKILDVLPSEYLSIAPFEQNVWAFLYCSTERTSKANSISYQSTKFIGLEQSKNKPL